MIRTVREQVDEMIAVVRDQRDQLPTGYVRVLGVKLKVNHVELAELRLAAERFITNHYTIQ